MLVLSRRPDEKIVFPNLGISVQVIRVAGKAVRIGVKAPTDVRVLREEVAEDDYDPNSQSMLMTRERRHELRNRLNTATLGLQLLQRQLELGQAKGIEETIHGILRSLREIELDLCEEPEATVQPTEVAGRRALIVEDNPMESELLAAYLRMSGYEVDTVSDGLEALEYLRQHRQPDAVLLDMCMPQLDGPTTINNIREEPALKNLKLFAVSGADREQMGVDVGPDGVDRWFAKPVNAQQLVSALNQDLADPQSA